MNQKAVLACFLVLLAAAAVALALMGGDTPPTPTTHERATFAEASPATSSRGEKTAADATATPSAAANDTLRADGGAGAHRPFRDDADWIVVRVVDKATGEKVPGATVFWYDERGSDRFNEDRSRTEAERGVEARRIERCAELFGWQTTTDQAGLAKVTRKGWIQIAALADGKYGTLLVGERALKPANGFVVELVPDRKLQVRVRDDHGEPVAAVPILLARYGNDDNVEYVWDWAPCAVTGADGIAEIEHLQLPEAQTREAAPHAIAGPWAVFAMLPGQTEMSAKVEIAPPPEQPVELRLPACGRVRARVEIAGKAVSDVRQIVLNAPNDQVTPFGMFTLMARPDADGWAHFPHVPLHQRLAAWSDAAVGSWRDFDGPIVRDQEVSIVLGPAAEEALLCGRLVSVRGEPAREQKFTLHLVTGEHTNDWSNEYRTDGDGRFMVSLGEISSDQAPFTAFLFDCEPEHAAPLRAEAPGRLPHAGVEELGDLVLRELAPFCSGRFVNGDRPWTEKVSCWILQRRIDDAGKEQWSSVDAVQVHQDGTGRFSVRGEARPGRYRLQLDASSTLGAKTFDFEPGVTDLVVAIDPGHSLAATMLVPPATPWAALHAHLIPDTPDPTDTGDDTAARYWQQPFSEGQNGQGRRHLQWPTLRAGTYTLEIAAAATNTVVTRIPGVRVPSGEPADPRLEDIDLRQAIRVVTARIVDASGKAPEYVSGMVTATEATAERFGFQFNETEFPFVAPTTPVDLTFFFDEHRPTRVRCDGPTLDVRAEDWAKVEITFPGIPKLPDETNAAVALRPIDPETMPWRSQWNSPDKRMLRAPIEQMVGIEGGKASLSIGEGRYKVVLTLHRRGVTVNVATGDTPEILATTGTTVVNVPEQAWQAALTKMELRLKARDGHDR